MRVLSNYVSLAIVLITSMILTNSFITVINRYAENIVRNNIEDKSRGLGVSIIGDEKFIIINKTIVGEPMIIGRYIVIYESGETLILVTNVGEKILVIGGDEIYEI